MNTDNGDCNVGAGTSTSDGVSETKEPVPPEFYIDDVEDVEGMTKKLTNLAGEKSFKYKCQADGTIKIKAATIAAYHIMTKFLRDKNIGFHTYQVRAERSFNVEISGLHKSYNIEDLKYFLKTSGHIVRSASVMQRRVYDSETQRQINIKLDKFIVHLEPRPNNKDVYNINSIDHCIVKINPPFKRESNGVPPICDNCSRRGHTKNYCFRPPKCGKCGGDHQFFKCDLPANAPAKCANCGQNHIARYKGCEDYKKRESGSI
jgi:hypothetical protein